MSITSSTLPEIEPVTPCGSSYGKKEIEFYRMRKLLPCIDCHRTRIFENFIIHQKVRDEALLGSHDDCCVECLETRLKRKITPLDFADDERNGKECIENYPKSALLMNRLFGTVQNALPNILPADFETLSDPQYRKYCKDINFNCIDCLRSTYCEYYMVYDSVWTAGGGDKNLLCIQCLETRLGRELIPQDFNPSVPVNYDHWSSSTLLMTRMFGEDYEEGMKAFEARYKSEEEDNLS